MKRLIPVALAAAVMVLLYWFFFQRGRQVQITYGISPYQDTALPVVAEKQGWYEEAGLHVRLKPLAWGDVMNALAAGGVDVAIQNFNSFQAVYPSLKGKGVNLVFYYPLFVFKGAAMMIRNDGKLKPLAQVLEEQPGGREKAIDTTVSQLRGKTIITTQGTEMEQIVLAAARRVGLDPGKDMKIIHAQPDDGLAAFLSGEGDVYSGGVTERTEARKHGAVEMIESADLTPAVIDGLVTTEAFARAHEQELLELIRLWFRTIEFMETDLDKHASIVTDYLAQIGSTKYTVEQYKYTWYNTEVFPKDPGQMSGTVLKAQSMYYWRKSWDANNKFLLAEKKIAFAVPHEVFWGERVHQKLTHSLQTRLEAIPSRPKSATSGHPSAPRRAQPFDHQVLLSTSGTKFACP